MFFFLFISGKVYAQCPEGDVTFVYQQDVDHFVVAYPNCTHITGSLKIGEIGNFNTTVSNISGLSGITTIDGELIISNTLLTNLQGLQNLNHTNGNLSIYSNSILTSLEQLSNLTEIAHLTVFFNQALTSLTGLQNITTINGNMRLNYNPLLQNLSLASLNSVGGYLEILSNPTLSSLSGLSNLESVSSFIMIANNNQLSSIEGLGNLINVEGGKIEISSNPQLTSLQGLQNVNLPGLEGTDIGLKITSNQSLTACSLPNICNYLALDSGNYPRTISGNTGNCEDEQAVLLACNLGVNDVTYPQDLWNAFYQKADNLFVIQSNGFQMSEIHIYNLNGQLIKELKELSSQREQFHLFSQNTILIVKVVSTEGKIYSKKVAIRK